MWGLTFREWQAIEITGDFEHSEVLLLNSCLTIGSTRTQANGQLEITRWPIQFQVGIEQTVTL